MANPPIRRPRSAIERAEAAFKSATSKPDEPTAPKRVLPPGKETVALQLDRDVLAHFQHDGPGWQERINAALRKAADL